MTIKLNALAAGLIGAAAIISGAVAGPSAPVNSNSEENRSVATTVSTAEPASRIYCYSGVTGTPTMQSRGWICQRETTPEKR
ncbi:MAG: hypothetical protein ACLPSF_10180 [Methylocella sp.]